MSATLTDQMRELMYVVDATAKLARDSEQISLPELQVVAGRLAALTGRLGDLVTEIKRQADELPERKILETSQQIDSYTALADAATALHDCMLAFDQAHELAGLAHDHLHEVQISVDLDAGAPRS